jgi:uncharacterized protein with PIN domain
MLLPDELEACWRQLAEEVVTGMKAWRLQHPQATFREIEHALDERLARVRARMLEDAALLSRAADWREASTSERPRCPQCGTMLESRGAQTRTLTTQYAQSVELKRQYAVCPQCQAGFFPPR